MTQMYMCRSHPSPVLLLAGCCSNLGLLRATNLLHSVLAFLALLATCPPLLTKTIPAQPILGLKLLGKVQCVVDEGEAGGLATSELGPEAEAEHHVRGGVVHGTQLLPHLGLGDGAPVRVNDVHHHLFPA
uniref:Putative secreted protein n=1 Tax=Ixodes ricinus TaxID=34613 RepID=A0A147BFC7_IXORI